MPWKWEPNTGRYRNDAGQFMSSERVLEFVNESIDASEGVVDQYATMVSNGTVSPSGWKTLMRQEIKEEYIRQYLLGIGGRPQMSPSDWGSLGGMLKEQYTRLNGFADDITDGKLSEAQIRQRSQMYINSAREGFERASQKTALETGNDEVRWVVDQLVENCEDCLDFSDKGWQKIEDDPYGGAFPGSGDTVCLTNCACHLEYRGSDGES